MRNTAIACIGPARNVDLPDQGLAIELGQALKSTQ
jgi:hypothetical protein